MRFYEIVEIKYSIWTEPHLQESILVDMWTEKTSFDTAANSNLFHILLLISLCRRLVMKPLALNFPESIENVKLNIFAADDVAILKTLNCNIGERILKKADASC